MNITKKEFGEFARLKRQAGNYTIAQCGEALGLKAAGYIHKEIGRSKWSE